VVSLQNLIKAVALPAAAKFAVVAALGIVLSFCLALLSRRIPGIRVILGTRPSPRRTTGREQQSTSRVTRRRYRFHVCAPNLGGPGTQPAGPFAARWMTYVTALPRPGVKAVRKESVSYQRSDGSNRRRRS